jgi:hypothetical protein
MAESTYQSQFKSWIFPGLVTILGMMIWNDVTEIKKDVKALMLQSSVDKTRIDNLERQVYKHTVTYKVPFPIDFPVKDSIDRSVAIMNKDEDDDVDNKDI